MPTGDYVICPMCGKTMNWGFSVCNDCAGRMTCDTGFTRVNTFIDPATEEKLKKLEARLKQVNDEREASNPLSPIKTLVVNLFAGPGTGKSTAAAGIFFDLKNLHINCELAFEFAKDLTWEKRDYTFNNQIYIFGEQHHRVYRLLGQVDVVITDSPILLTPVYDTEKRASLEQLVLEEHSKMWTYNVFLKRLKSYNPIGRRHDEDHAHKIDKKVLEILDRTNQSYETFEASTEGKTAIVKKVLLLLENRP